MKWFLMLMALLATSLVWLGEIPTAQCPEDPNDSGICDTLYVEVYPPDTLLSGFARVLVRVTHDVPNPAVDSLVAFDVALSFTRTNPSKFCSVTHHWNNMLVHPTPPELLERSIFRHIIEGGDTLVHNWMMGQSQMLTGQEWDRMQLNLDGTSHFWFATVVGVGDQHFGEGRRVLLLTMTFRMEDTMTICIDSSTWPPSTRLSFFNATTADYVPRHFLPYCFSLKYAAVGDANSDGQIDIADVVFLLNYLYRGGLPPVPLETGDTNDDEVVDLGDVVFLLNYLFRGGPERSQ